MDNGFRLLARRYGVPVIWRTKDTKSIDLNTGETTNGYVETLIQRAIVIHDDVVEEDSLSRAMQKLGGVYKTNVKTLATQNPPAKLVGLAVIGGVEYTYVTSKLIDNVTLIKVQHG